MASSSSSSTLRFPYPATLNPASFVSMKLSSIDNYSLWETQMLCLLESQELVGFIDDTIPTPNGGTPMTVAVDEDYRRWKRCDRLVKGWILGSLHESVLATVVGLSTARAVWIKLRSTLGPNSQGNREDEEEEEAMAGHDQTRYLPLYKDGLEGDWDKAKIFMDGERGASTAFIALNGDTIIHLAVGTGKAIHFLKRLVEYLPIQDLSLRNNNGDTPLVTAARVGNTEAAKILLGKRRDLLRIMNNEICKGWKH